MSGGGIGGGKWEKGVRWMVFKTIVEKKRNIYNYSIFILFYLILFFHGRRKDLLMFFCFFICYNASGWNWIFVDTDVTECRKRERSPIVWRSEIRGKRKRFKIGHVYVDRKPMENGATWNRQRSFTADNINTTACLVCTLYLDKSKLTARFSYTIIFVKFRLSASGS